jgi:hypothetical protein
MEWDWAYNLIRIKDQHMPLYADLFQSAISSGQVHRAISLIGFLNENRLISKLLTPAVS